MDVTFKYFLFFAVKAEVVEPGCRLPQNFTGDWINTANLDADVFANETHIIETWYPDQGRYRRTIYVCREQRDTRFMMARLTVDGWWLYLATISRLGKLCQIFVVSQLISSNGFQTMGGGKNGQLS